MDLNQKKMDFAIREWLWKKVWNTMNMEAYSHVCEDYDMEELDPKDIFTYLIEDHQNPFTMHHFIAHMENMRNGLSEQRFREHKQWVFNEKTRHVPTLIQLLKALLNTLLCRFITTAV